MTNSMSNIPLLNSIQTTTVPMIPLRLDINQQQNNNKTNSTQPNPSSNCNIVKVLLITLYARYTMDLMNIMHLTRPTP